MFGNRRAGDIDMPIARDGKYDDLAIKLIFETKAAAAIVLIVGGDKGHGMSVAAADLKALEALPIMLRELADGIERDSKNADRLH